MQGKPHLVVGVGVADHGLVIVVEDTVRNAFGTVDICEHHVTGLDGRALLGLGGVAVEVLFEVSLFLGFVLDDAVHLIAPEVTDGITHF